jgi:hypothetical protein
MDTCPVRTVRRPREAGRPINPTEFEKRVSHLRRVAKLPATRELADVVRTLKDLEGRIADLLDEHRAEGHSCLLCREIEHLHDGGPGVWDGLLMIASVLHLYRQVIDPYRPTTGFPPATTARPA